MDQFPSSKFKRGQIFTKAGLKVGSNYAKHHLQKILSTKDDKNDKRALHTRNAQELYRAFTKLRGTALKIAQSVSVDNSGLLPDEFIEVMSESQYKVPPINPSLVRSIIKRELGAYPEELFESFDTQATAAASIGQVHIATHKTFGKLAVKIQYPNVRETIETDLKMAKTIFKNIVRSKQTDSYFEEIRDRLMEETDYVLEGNRIEYFNQQYAGEHLTTPRWIKELSTARVLTMTFLDGIHIGEFLERNPSQEDRDHFGQLLWNFFHDQINDERTIHADAHPGNFMFLKDRSLGVLDFGCVKTFPADFFNGYMSALPLHIKEDVDALYALYQRLELIESDDSSKGAGGYTFQFFKEFGDEFMQPYLNDTFSFDDEIYRKRLSSHLKKATEFKEPVGSKHFIYSSKVHMGLYNMLFQLKSTIHSKRSLEILNQYFDKNNPLVSMPV